MSKNEQSQAASVSDTAFAREMWRHSETGNIEAAKDVRMLWKYGQESEGYARSEGALTAYEITAFAEKFSLGAANDVIGFARAIERAALIKAYTLLPELRQAEDAKHHRRYFRDGVRYGLAVYSGAIRALAMGQIRGEADVDEKPSARLRASDIKKIEVAGDAESKRPSFEAWAGNRQFDLTRKDGSYSNLVTSYVWMGRLGALLSVAPACLSTGGKGGQ